MMEVSSRAGTDIDVIQQPAWLNLELCCSCDKVFLFSWVPPNTYGLDYPNMADATPCWPPVPEYSNRAICAGAGMTAIGPTRKCLRSAPTSGY